MLSKLPVSPTIQRIIAYVFFGGTAFVIDAGTLWFLRDVCHLPAWLGAFIAFSVATVYSFLTQQRITFQSHASTAHSIPRYAFLLVCNSLFTTGIVHIFDVAWDLYMVGKILGTVCISIWNFFLFQYWVFPRED